MSIAPRFDLSQERASTDGAMRLLFGASAIDAKPEDRTEIRHMGDLRVRAEQSSRTPEATDSYAFSDVASVGIPSLLSPLS